jgi:Zn-dependent protease
MRRILGEKEASRAALADPVAGQASIVRPASGLKASSFRTPAAQTSVAKAVVRGMGRAVWGAVFAIAVKELISGIFAGLPMGPASLAFKAFGGALLFWSVIESITAHEVGHAWTALKVGDVTPRNAGQISLNPLRFTGPIGATILLVTSMMGFPLGAFGTNVQQSFDKTENKRAMAVMAFAGPLVNFLIGGGIFVLVLGMKTFLPGAAMLPWVGGSLRILGLTALMNFMLGILNLIPLGPLDGQKVLAGVIPDKWHKHIQKITYMVGLVLLLAFMVWGLGTSTHKAVTQGGAGTPFGNTGSTFIMSLMGNGALLWLATMIPVAVKLAKGLRAAWERRKVLNAGGIPMSLTLPILKGKAPEGRNTKLVLAVPSSGDPAVSKALAGKEFFITNLEEVHKTPPENLRILQAGEGKELPFDESFVEGVRLGRLLLLHESNNEFFAAVPERFVGGRSEVLAMTETAFLASRPEGVEAGRRLLKPGETALVLDLSRKLQAPVYELALAADSERPSLARWARTERGGAFFLRDDVIAKAAGAPGLQKDLAEYLRLLRESILNPADISWKSAEEAFLSLHPELAALK